MSFSTFLPYYILLLFEITATLFVLIIIAYLLWEWLMRNEVEERRVIKNM